MGKSILKVKNVYKNFGGVHALEDVSLEITEGRVCALMGENGAGKSTLGKIISGIIPATSGTIEFAGEVLNSHTALEAQQRGIAIIMQELDLFFNQTIAENIALANANFPRYASGFINHKKLNRECSPWLEKVGLNVSPSKPLSELPIGQVQLVAIARALSMNCRLIIMDEPTSSLTAEGVTILFKLIRELKGHGITIIYVSHKMSEIFEIADDIIVMRDGRYVDKKRTEDTSPDEIIALMVGREIDSSAINRSYLQEQVVLELQNLTTRHVTDISLKLRKGEVLGMAGLVGAGRSELAEALFGLDSTRSGKVILKGQEIVINNPKDAMDAGIGFVPEDRKWQGLMMKQSVEDNLCMSIHDRISSRGFINKHSVEDSYLKASISTKLKAASSRIGISTLSGGNQQKVLLSRWLLVDPEIIFLDEPTRGIDVGAKQDIYEIIEDLAAQGKSVILVSSELPELLRCCDRIAVMSAGRLAGIVEKDSTDQEEIMNLAMKYL